MAKIPLRAEGIIRERDVHGKIITYHKGDWFEIQNKQRAREYIETGQAIIPGVKEAQKEVLGDMADCGVVVRTGDVTAASLITGAHEEIQAVAGGIELPFERTMLWDVKMPMTPIRAALGFNRLEINKGNYGRWEMAAMLKGHQLLALNWGTKADKEGTKALFGDLMLPVYDTAAVWIRKTRNTEAFTEAWRDLVAGGCGEEHAFIRALYVHRVILCTLPTGWLARWVAGE